MLKSLFTCSILLFGSQVSFALDTLPDLKTRVYHQEEYSAGDNPYKVKRYAPEYYANHANHFEEGMTTHPSAPIWSITPPKAFATIHVIDAPQGLILIDTGLNKEQMEPVAQKIKTLSDKPIKAVIYTHPHADHTGGVGAFITHQQADKGEVEVIADATFMDAYISENAATGPIMGQRAIFMYGALLQPADKEQFTTGCCGHFTAGSTDFVAPTYTTDTDTETRDVLGLELTFVHSGGENAGHLIIYSPKYKTVFIGDELQGPAAPQLHSPRGTKFRDTNAWVAAIDKIRALKPEHMLPGHGKAEYGKENVDNILVIYRDFMQFQHDQAIRLINQGKNADDLANEIKIPDYLTLDPFTVETYGNVKTNTRSFYTGYISWFDGNAANLDPLPQAEEDRKLVEAMGGRDKVFKLSEAALKAGDIKWSVALSDKLVRIDNNDMPARHLKAAGLRHLGYATINSSNRGFYLTGADELDGLIDMKLVAKIGKAGLFSPEIVSGMATNTLMDNMRYRVLPDQVKGTNTGYYFRFSDTGEEFTLYLRNGILEVNQAKLDHQVSIETNRLAFNTLFTNDVAPKLSELGKVKGPKEALSRFDDAIDFALPSVTMAVK
ncbi:MBL fold metallo-hydrolase [Photobacterium sagamiensis]|uniref:alkyl sulfatase dimerization domain-containing protein n=1 Tax=Photobacterium sagamiensis TaxID=2910241 RepID=UPI003D0B90B3